MTLSKLSVYYIVISIIEYIILENMIVNNFLKNINKQRIEQKI